MADHSYCAPEAGFYYFDATVANATKKIDKVGTISFRVLGQPITTSAVSIKLNTKQAAEISIELLSMDGRQVVKMAAQQFASGESAIEISLDSLANGVYLLVLTTNTGILHEKIIVQR